jgi:hypothetical protein
MTDRSMGGERDRCLSVRLSFLLSGWIQAVVQVRLDMAGDFNRPEMAILPHGGWDDLRTGGFMQECVIGGRNGWGTEGSSAFCYYSKNNGNC